MDIMAILKKVFPFSFNVKEKDVNTLVVSIVIYLVAGLVATLVMWILGSILGFLMEFLSVIFWLVGTVVDLYCLGGIVLAVLKFFDVLK